MPFILVVCAAVPSVCFVLCLFPTGCPFPGTWYQKVAAAHLITWTAAAEYVLNPTSRWSDPQCPAQCWMCHTDFFLSSNCSTTYCWETAGIQLLPLAETPVLDLICQIEDAPLWLAKAQLPLLITASFIHYLSCLSCTYHIQLSQIRAPLTSYFSCTIQLELRRLAVLL